MGTVEAMRGGRFALEVPPAALTTAPRTRAYLLLIAAAGKILETVGPVLNGVSMVPHAGVVLTVMQRGLAPGGTGAERNFIAGRTVVSAVTPLGLPLLLCSLFQQRTQQVH